jgi:hypothetical protein
MTNETSSQEEECEICGGTGEVSILEQVWPNEPQVAPVGTRKCECRIVEEDNYE